MHRPHGPALVTSVLALLVLTAAMPLASAHNPALSLYEPAPLDGGLVVLGEEGTAALLETDGTERWTTQLDAHVLQPPVAAHGLAVTTARTLATLDPVAIALSPEGEVWRVGIGPPGALGWTVATDDGFATLTTGGQLTILSTDGSQQDVRELGVEPVLPPVSFGDGWLITTRGKLLHVGAGGDTLGSVDLSGAPTDVRVTADRVLVAFGDLRTRHAGVLALDHDLDPVWSRAVPGIRVGGALALTDHGIGFGTYSPDGARVALLSPNGTVAWDTVLDGRTAAAASTDGQALFAATNGAVVAVNATGALQWQVEDLAPRIAPPTVVDGLVLPAGANNTLVALDADTGDQAWSWTDGVREVPWTDEELAQRPTPSGEEGPTSTPLSPWLALAGLAAALTLRRRPR